MVILNVVHGPILLNLLHVDQGPSQECHALCKTPASVFHPKFQCLCNVSNRVSLLAKNLEASFFLACISVTKKIGSGAVWHSSTAGVWEDNLGLRKTIQERHKTLFTLLFCAFSARPPIPLRRVGPVYVLWNYWLTLQELSSCPCNSTGMNHRKKRYTSLALNVDTAHFHNRRLRNSFKLKRIKRGVYYQTLDRVLSADYYPFALCLAQNCKDPNDLDAI